MIVNDKYRLGAMVRSGEVATFEAEEVSTGRSFYVHLLAGAPVGASLALQVSERLAAERGSSSPLIEQGEYEGAPFVVTEATPDLVDLRRWIEAQSGPGHIAGKSAESSPSAASEPSREPGEFTRLFQGAGAPGTAAGPGPSGPASTRPPTAASPNQTGSEFDAAPAREGSPFAAPPPAPAPSAAGPPPGEFTRNFGSPQTPAGGDSRLEAAAPGSGSTGLTPASRDAAPEGPAAGKSAAGGSPTAESATGESGGGEFTRLFGQKQAAGPNPVPAPFEPASPAPAPVSPLEPPSLAASRAGGPQPPFSAPNSPPPPRDSIAPAPPPSTSRTSIDSEFTRLFGGDPGPDKKNAESPPSAIGEPHRELPPSAPAPRPGPPPQSGAREPASACGTGESGISESGMRRMSPEERRQEMRQFRKIAHPGGEHPELAAEAEGLPAEPPVRPPAVQPPAGERPAERPPASVPQDPGGKRQAGEFTRLFLEGSPAASIPPPVPPQRPAAPAPPAGASDQRSAQLGGPGSTPPSGDPFAPRVESAPPAADEFWGKPSPPAPPPASPPLPPAGTFDPPYARPGERGGPGGEPPKGGQTGEFTKLFRQGKPSSGRHEPIPPPAPPPPPASSGAGGGEFTRLFGGGRSAGQEPDPWSGRPAPPERDPWSERPQPPPQQASEPGGFTRLFGGGGGGGAQSGGDPFSAGSQPWPPNPAPQPLEPENQPGAFTKLFGGTPGRGAGESPAWKDTPQHPGGATQISRNQPAPPQAPPPPSPSQGPSDYTRMMGHAPPPPRQQAAPTQHPGMPDAPPAPPPVYPAAAPVYAPPAAAPPPAPAPAAAPAAAAPAQPARQRPERDSSDRSMYLILALLFCALLVVALGIVLFVSLTGNPEPQPAPGSQGLEQAPQASAASPASGGSSALSGVRAPGVSSPSLSGPSVSGPSVSAPSVSGSGISGGSVTAPSVSRPSVSSPSLSQPTLPTVPRVSGGQVSGGQLATAVSAAQTGQPAAEGGGTPYLALIIMLSVLLVIAVGAAVFFALRRA